jgi:hypothetical protein
VGRLDPAGEGEPEGEGALAAGAGLPAGEPIGGRPPRAGRVAASGFPWRGGTTPATCCWPWRWPAELGVDPAGDPAWRWPCRRPQPPPADSGVEILDETYNASPEAVLAALDLLAAQPGRRFAVLGTMLELGDLSLELHSQVAKRAAALGLDGLVIVDAGAEGEAMAAAAGGLGPVWCNTPRRRPPPLLEWLRAGGPPAAQGQPGGGPGAAHAAAGVEGSGGGAMNRDQTRPRTTALNTGRRCSTRLALAPPSSWIVNKLWNTSVRQIQSGGAGASHTVASPLPSSQK